MLRATDHEKARELRDSIIADGATVRDAVIEESLIGPNAVIDGGFSKLDVGDSSNINTK